MKKSAWLSLAGVTAVAALVGFLIVGCDDAPLNNEIIVVPGSISIYGADTVVVLTASGKGTADPAGETNRAPRIVVSELFLPLEWTVSNPELGAIAGREGFTAVYVSTGKLGNQVISVHDQGTSRGIAVISQIETPPDTNTTVSAEAAAAAE